jgi:hypothetical protein
MRLTIRILIQQPQLMSVCEGNAIEIESRSQLKLPRYPMMGSLIITSTTNVLNSDINQFYKGKGTYLW